MNNTTDVHLNHTSAPSASIPGDTPSSPAEQADPAAAGNDPAAVANPAAGNYPTPVANSAAAREGRFTVVSINISERKGEKKRPVGQAVLTADHGIMNDAHAGPWIRQVSLLGDEDISTMRGRGIDLKPGDFAENLTIRGVKLAELPIGTRIIVGDAVLEVTKIGKECHHGCAIRQVVGDCVMPRAGIFARVVKGGIISDGDTGLYRL